MNKNTHNSSVKNEDNEPKNLKIQDGVALALINACASNSGFIPNSHFCSENITKVFALN